MIEHLAVLNAVRDAIFVADIDTGMLVDANPAAEALCGRSLTELRLLHHTRLHPPDRAESARSSFIKHAQDPTVTEGLVLHKDGHQIPVEISSSPFTAPDGRRMLIGVFRDITERAAEREALRRSEERFRQVAESVGDFIWETDASGLYLYASPALEQILGYAPEDVVGKRYFYDLFVPETRDEIKEAAFEVFARKEQFRAFLNWNVTKDGRSVALETSGAPILDRHGTLRGYHGVDTDVTERRRAEETLAASEEKYRALIEATGTGYLILDNRGKVIDANREYVRLSGHRELGQILGRSVIEWTAAHEREKNAEAVARCLRDGFIRNLVIDYVDAGNHVTPIEINAKIIGAGDSIRILSLCRDITERKQAEGALRESEERFRNMADTAPVMIWVTGPEKQLTFVNKTWLEFTGRTMEEELESGWSAGVHPEDLPRFFEAFCTAFDARRSFQVECRMRRKDREYRSILCSGVPRFAPGGVFAGYIGSDIDITDLQSEERFRQLAENIDQVFWMLDLGTQQILYVSPAFEKVWGCSAAALYQNRGWLVESVHPEDRGRFTDFLTKVSSEAAEEAYRIVRPDGSVRWIQDRAFLVCGPDGKPYRVAGIAEDVTAHQELEEQLRQAQKMEAVGRLAGGIAHDFNNLLTIIGGYSQMLLDGTPAKDQRREQLESILSAANRASILTRQLLAFSRQQVLQPRVVSVNHLLTNMEALLRPLIGEHITLETEFDPSVSCIKVDPHQIEQVLMNLAANARDAMPAGGRLRIQTSMAAASDIGPDNRPREVGKRVRLRISDTGCGMDERTRERAFEPFFTTKGPGKGTGLGLSTVYGIVRQNQGEIHVSSTVGRGTVFDVYFPAVPESETESDAPAHRPRTRAATETVLVAEDEAGVRGLVRQTLEQLGYTVLEATNGIEALRVVEQHASEIHLLLTDVIMPLMNGHELSTRLRSIRPGTKVLYMSGYADDVLAFHGIARPDMAYIQKPFTPSQLAWKVEAVLSADRGYGR